MNRSPKKWKLFLRGKKWKNKKNPKRATKKSHKIRKDFEITLGHMYLFIIKYILWYLFLFKYNSKSILIVQVWGNIVPRSFFSYSILTSHKLHLKVY